MSKKIILSHREVEVKVLLEVLAVYAILALVFTGIYYLEPTITGFSTMIKSYDYANEVNLKFNISDEIIKTILSFALIVIVPFLLYKFVLFSGKMSVEILKKAGESREEYKEFKGQRQSLLELKKKEKEKVKKNIQKKRKGKSRMFVKCHELLLNANKSLRAENVDKANNLYSKARETYIGLDYWEKKEIYDELKGLYNQLNR